MEHLQLIPKENDECPTNARGGVGEGMDTPSFGTHQLNFTGDSTNRFLFTVKSNINLTDHTITQFFANLVKLTEI